MKNITQLLILLICLTMSFESGFAQNSPANTSSPVNLGALNDKAKSLGRIYYPILALDKKPLGAVVVNVVVNTQGKVIKAEAVSGDNLLRDAAVNAARQTIFNPYVVLGKAVEFAGVLIFNFTAEDLKSAVALAGFTSTGNALEKSLDQRTDAQKEDDPFDLKGKNKNMLKDAVNKIGTDNPAKGTDYYCTTAFPFYELKPMIMGDSWVLAPTSMLKLIVSNCDDAIKESSTPSLKYYSRGMARYYLLRKADEKTTYFTSRDIPLSKGLANAATLPVDELRKSLDDLKIFLNDPGNAQYADERKIAYLADAELKAVSAVIDKKPELFQSALLELDAAQKAKMLKAEDNNRYNRMILEDHLTLGAVAKNTSGNTINAAAIDDIVARYLKYSGEYGASEALYKRNVQSFQEMQKAQGATPNTAQLCPALSAMNTSYQTLKANFAKIIEMKNKGELSGDAELVKQVELREAQQPKVQASIDATTAKYACK